MLTTYSPAAAASAPDAGLDNCMNWQGQPGHYEVWYMTLSHLRSRTGFWLRYTLESPDVSLGPPYAQLWFCRGDAADPTRTFGINRRFPIASLRAESHPFALHIGAAQLEHHRMSGSLDGHGHSVRWELRWTPAPRSHRHLPAALYDRRLPIAETLVLSPNLSVPVSGTIEVDGQRYEFSGDPGGQSHLWGRKHAYAWAWAHCNAFDVEGGIARATPAATVLEALTVRMRRGPVVLPLTLLSVYPDGLTGETLAFNAWQHLPLNRSDCRTGYYALTGVGAAAKVEAVLTCRPEDMVRAEYIDPDGAPAYCHNTVVASCHLNIWRRAWPGARLRLWRQFYTQHGGHFEWAGRAGDSLVKKRHLLLEE